MALGTNYSRNPSGLWDIVTCYKMAVVGKNEEKKGQFKKGIENFKNASPTMRQKALKEIEKFEKEYLFS